MQSTPLSIYSVPLILLSQYSLLCKLSPFTRKTDQQSKAKAQMEKPRKVESLSDGTRVCSYPSSPEFEFWMVRNPSLPQPNFLTADDLFSDGVLLPLDFVHTSAALGFVEHESAIDDAAAGPELKSAATGSEHVTGSRRWKDIFKMSGKEVNQKAEDVKMKKKREQKLSNGGGQGAASSAELNINIWPFSRSRSAGTGGDRTKVVTRKVSSAPCSRSNSGGESKSRKWPASPARGGVHVGRSSPVRQVKGQKSGIPVGGKAKGAKGCKEETSTAGGCDFVGRNCEKGRSSGSCGGGNFGGRGCEKRRGGGSNDESGVVNSFNFRSLFSKKVY